jgi:uncharacterized membrane protein
MEKILSLGKWLFVASFSFYVFLHFALPQVGVEKYVPKYLPFPLFWNYFTGAAIVAFILSAAIGKYDKLASVLLAVYLVLVTVLIHAPNAQDPMELLNVFRITNMIGGALMFAQAFAKDKRVIG